MPLYKQDPNDTSKQIPDSTPRGIHRYSYATCPAEQTITKRPTYVMLNNAGTYAFAYESGSYPADYISGSVVDADSGPVRLDISPVAWQGNPAAKVGDVTFVYVRVN